MNYLKTLIFRLKFELGIVGAIITSMSFRGFVASSDGASSWYSPWYNLLENFFVWNTYNVPGNFSSNNFTSFFLRLFYSFFEIFTTNPAVIQKLAWIVFFSFVSVLIYRMIRYQYGNVSVDAFFLTIFVILNPISQYYLWSKQHWAYYLVPVYFIAFSLYRNYIITKDRVNLFLIVLVWCLAGFAINQPAYFVPWVISIFPVFLWAFFMENSAGNRIRLFVDNFIFLAVFLAVNSVYILPIVLVGGEQLDNARSAYASGDRLPLLRDLSGINTFHSFFGFTNGYTDTFGSNWIEIILWTSFVVMILYLFLIKSGDHIKRYEPVFFPVLIGLLIVIFLNKGLSPPFSDFSESLFSIREMYIFRDFKDKFALLFSLLIGVSSIILIRQSKGFRLSLFLVTTLSFLSFSFTFWLPKDFAYSDPLTYIRSVNFATTSSYRVLNLPLLNYSFYFTSEPQYSGDSPLKNIFKQNIIYTSAQQDTPILYLKENLISDKVDKNFIEFFLKEYGVRYIFNNKNSFVKEDKEPDLYDYTVLKDFNFLKLVQESGYYQVFEYSQYYPKILALNADFIKESNVEYRIYISNLSSTNLVFLDTYHPGWKLFLIANPRKISCKEYTEFTPSNQKECINKSRLPKIYPGYEIAKNVLIKSDKNLFGHSSTNSGFITKAPINNWVLSAETIKNSYSDQYFISNPDGTIDVEIVLYFEKQFYFLIGLTVSVLSFGFLIFYLLKRFPIKLFNF